MGSQAAICSIPMVLGGAEGGGQQALALQTTALREGHSSAFLAGRQVGPELVESRSGLFYMTWSSSCEAAPSSRGAELAAEAGILLHAFRLRPAESTPSTQSRQ